MWVYVYVYAHTCIHTAREVLRCEPRGRDETPRGPEESRCITSRHIFIRICVQSTHVIHMAEGGVRSWTDCFFFFNIFILPKKKRNKM